MNLVFSRRHLAALTLGLGLMSHQAWAQTWAANRQHPTLKEIVTIDQTGENGWLWGREDVAGDGLDTFEATEQAIDGRAVYVTTDNGRLWIRLTLSATTAPEGNLVFYLFIDADRDSAKGRTAAAPEIDPAFTSDPTDGGYEYVVAVRGDGTLDSLWSLNNGVFSPVALTADEVIVERGRAIDPLRIGTDERGYVQAAIQLSRVGLNSQCDARFFVRATNDNAVLGKGDLEIGRFDGCLPSDSNRDAVPDVLEPTYECGSTVECAADAVCWNGHCWFASTCVDATDCSATETCDNGQCRVVGGDGCSGSSGCDGLVCRNRECVACSSNAECGADHVCAPDGRCVTESVANDQVNNNPGTGGAGGSGGSGGNAGSSGSGNGNGAAGEGVVLGDGERVQGGACACTTAGTERTPWGFGFVLSVLGLVGWFGRNRSSRERAR
jgi:uncharacterized membrane protein YgcG